MKEENDIININYRLADIERWKCLDFVIGYTINRSKNCDKSCQICSDLEGIYPKDFIWHGWHFGCMCYLTPVMVNKDEFDDNELSKLKAAFKGEKYTQKKRATPLPNNFIKWCNDNMERLTNDGKIPYFIYKNSELINKYL